ncbi:eCIS core domain-containing protein [Spongiimicrobium salis]|uniref:eCIS core domain-containing protein n=1 Tax=Spongiimicrobium salis TaxID=1667022 RepID=UPI00374D5B5B
MRKRRIKENVQTTSDILSQATQRSTADFQFKDKRAEAIQTVQLQEMIQDNSKKAFRHIQRKKNTTGLPDQLKSGIEQLSGYAMDNVKVHYNSSKPAQLQAHAYAQGADIHLGPGQEQHLPHEAWHVVQQKQGRVQPRIQLKGRLNINDDMNLEKEADVMGTKAMQLPFASMQKPLEKQRESDQDVHQLSVWSWIKKSGVSLFNTVVGAAFRVPKRILNLAKHITIDLIRAIYLACNPTNAHGGAGLMQEQSPMKHWGLGLLTKIGDVLNLRELMGFLATLLGTPLSKVRGLTTEEKTLAREIFGDSMNLSDVSIFEKSAIAAPAAGPGGAFTVAHTIHGDHAFSDAADQANHEKRQAVLMHELMHIAQEKKQGILSWIELQWGRNRTNANPTPAGQGQTINSEYNYGIIVNASLFRDYSREQQGAIVQDYALYLKRTPVATRNAADMIHGEYGSGQYQDYQTMLQGLRRGHWLSPVQHPEWKRTIG